MSSAHRMDWAEARGIAVRALTGHGVADGDAGAVADALVETTARGVATHGLRLLPGYLDDLERGVANPRPKIGAVRESGPAVLLDADAALGVVAGLAGAAEAVRRAAEYGIAAVVVRNSNHFAAASIHSRAMSRAGMVGWVMTSASSRVAPYGGVAPLLGTNPVSVAAGADGDHEFVLDMATSQVCLGEVRERGRRGRALEGGWALDGDGRETRSPGAARALSPLAPGYKGQGLGMAVTLMTAALADAPLDWQLDHIERAEAGRGREVAHFLLCLDPAFFGGGPEFADRLHDLVETVRGAGDSVRCPGDPERERRRDALRDGVPLDPETAASMRELARRYGADETAARRPS
ncbi:Ldh family oxidoreductase [Streptomyces sp. NPDC050504]|uniref:Ldh family oxidoreductase n=1 Tax=Streptomyces sp. NPDC050504 TaxID=3365618 RepID=UPI0037A5309A